MGSLERYFRKLPAANAHRYRNGDVERDSWNNVKPTSEEDSSVAFEAQSSFGRFVLTVSNPQLHERQLSNVVHALYLDAIEDHIRFIENWLGTSVYLKPLSEGQRHEACFVRLSRPSVDPLVVSLRLPARTWALLQDLPNSCVSDLWKIDWMALPCRMILGEVTLNKGYIQQIAPGMVVLLPESFLNPWKVYLQVARQELMCAGHLDSRARCWRRAFDSTGQGWHVVPKPRSEHMFASVCVTLSVKGDRLTGMRSTADVYLGEELSQFTCYMRLPCGQNALGFLVPVAGGYGFQVKVCGSSVTSLGR